MNVLLIGSGGREHALAWKLKQSTLLTQLYIAPGNPGTESLGTNLPIAADDFESLKQCVLHNHINLVVVGPEDPLVKGIADFFHSDPLLNQVPVIGPSQSASRLEGSKEFAKNFMLRHGIPTARYKAFTLETVSGADDFMQTLNPPYVLKADGLAAGKGVVILPDIQKARMELRAMLGGKFGEAGKTVVIEEFLSGIELSVFILTDGHSYLVLPEAKDYKRIGEGDSGPNTGGMGSVSPVSFAGPEFMEKVESRIIGPTIGGLQQEGIEYRGFLFFGLINVQGDPFVIEYNVRLGDPETESVMPRLKNDLLSLLLAVAERNLHNHSIEADPRHVVTLMLVSGGYPGEYEKGKEIEGLYQVESCLLFHAGTAKADEKTITRGGRVIAISAYGSSLAAARSVCLKNAALVKFEKKYYRSDIGFDLL